MEPIEMNGDCKFLQDLENPNNNGVNRGLFNLIVSIRDLKLYSKGMKPHRGWKVTSVKKYFGIKGNTIQVLNNLEYINKMLKEDSAPLPN
jgi:hypothetical protein